MSVEGARLLKVIATLFAAAQHPDHAVWYFHPGQNNAVHDELAALGLIMKVFGTPRGFAWRLTDLGRQQLPQSR